ncbi:hypothetical protein L208DRAFT_1378233 [Tricholoma matsutake]|nr:hypothetical protein L208DRAFT_1378233 [Tricholoma matsutake 945]
MAPLEGCIHPAGSKHSMACYLASSGMAEGRVGGALQAIGKAFGLGTPHKMSQWTVQQAVLGSGIAADIQLGYEMITAKNYTNPQAEHTWKLIGTGGDHANDQKKSHKILYTWKMDMLYHQLAEETILKMDAMQMLALLLPLKAKQIEDMTLTKP